MEIRAAELTADHLGRRIKLDRTDDDRTFAIARTVRIRYKQIGDSDETETRLTLELVGDQRDPSRTWWRPGERDNADAWLVDGPDLVPAAMIRGMTEPITRAQINSTVIRPASDLLPIPEIENDPPEEAIRKLQRKCSTWWT